MITAEFSAENKCVRLTMKGHAGQAEKGRDIICASASMLAYTLAQTAIFMHAEGKLRKKPKIRLESGDANIVVKATDDAYAEALHSFLVVQNGFGLLAKNYPQFVQVRCMGI